MAIIGLFQCDPWCLPTLKNATNEISIHEFHNVTRHYVKDTFKYRHEFNLRMSTWKEQLCHLFFPCIAT